MEYFFDDFRNFQNVDFFCTRRGPLPPRTQSGPLPPYVSPEYFKKYKKIVGTSQKYYLSISGLSENLKISKIWEHRTLLFSIIVFLILGIHIPQNKNRYSSVYFKLFDGILFGGQLLWQNAKINNPTETKIFLRKYDTFFHDVWSAWNLGILNK